MKIKEMKTDVVRRRLIDVRDVRDRLRSILLKCFPELVFPTLLVGYYLCDKRVLGLVGF